jgi:hypothetical protein
MGLLDIIFGKKNKETKKEKTVSLEEYISNEIRSGKDPEELRAELKKDLHEGGEIFGEFREQFKATIKTEVTEVKNTNQRHSIKWEEGVQLFSWTLDSGAEHCDDCINRSKMHPRPMKEWEIIGIPGEGITECGDHCKCHLEKVGVYRGDN